MKARSALLGYAVTLGLVEVHADGGGFVWSLGLVCLLVGWIPAAPSDARSAGLQVFRPGGFALAAALIAWVAIHGALSLEAPAALVTVIRVVALTGLLVVPLTPPAARGLHALGLILCAWSLASLQPEPAPLELALGLLLLAGALDGLRQSPSRRSTVSLAVLLMGILPWLSGLELPRWNAAVAAPVTPSHPPPSSVDPDLESGVDPDQVWATGETARRSMRLVATVKAPQLEGDLLLRVAALEGVRRQGFYLRPELNPQPECLQPVRVEAQVELNESVSGYLPCVGIPREISLSHSLSDAGAALVQAATYPLDYTAVGEVVHPRFLLAGRDSLSRPDLLELPGGLPPELGALARDAVEGREGPWRKALAAARWLQDRAEYADTEFAEGDLYPRLQAFLTRTRTGVCTEFAAALVVFLRSQGVPCRLVLGYRSEDREPDGTYLVRALHAHAWVELPLQGAGWVAIDPTPGGSLPLPPEPGPAPTPPPEPGSEWGDGGRLLLVRLRPLLGTLVALALLAVVILRLRQQLGERHRGWRAQLEAVGSAPKFPERERWLQVIRGLGYRVGGAETPADYLRRRGAGPAWLEGNALYERARFGGADPAVVAEFRRWLDEAAAGRVALDAQVEA